MGGGVDLREGWAPLPFNRHHKQHWLHTCDRGVRDMRESSIRVVYQSILGFVTVTSGLPPLAAGTGAPAAAATTTATAAALICTANRAVPHVDMRVGAKPTRSH